jgi:6-phospho-beta-glucosidase
MSGLKIAVIGAGSTYTPELIEGFIKRKDVLPVSAFYLMDIDERKLNIVGNLAKRMLDEGGVKCEFVLTMDLKIAVENADFVLGQIRVGKLDARIKDEKIPLKYGLIGQETTGIGGFMKALRTIPAIMEITRLMEKYSPDAWLINFSNPSGIISEAVLNHTRIKMIGLCNIPVGYIKWFFEKFPWVSRDAVFDYVGLNHLSWLVGVYDNGSEIFQEMLNGNEEFFKLKNIPDLGWDKDLLKAVKGLPCGYLQYYYFRDKQLEHLKLEEKSRGEVCKEIEEELLQMYINPELKEKPAALEKRGGAYYSEAAVSLIDAIYNNKNEVHIVNVKNQGVLDFMGYDDVIEIGCNVNREGAAPIPLKSFENAHIEGMMKMVKSFEKHAVLAGLHGDYQEAIKALLIHPLAGDYDRAKGAFDELLEAHRKDLPQFFR